MRSWWADGVDRQRDMLVDSHCHLDPSHFSSGADEPLGRARAAGVGAFVCVGVGEGGSAAAFAVDLAERAPDVWAAVGMHPHEAASLDDALFDELAGLAGRSRVVAVGEIGLDYHYDYSPREAQRAVFRRMIALARGLGKPVVVHTREAADDTLRILGEERARDVGGIFHCFTEGIAVARLALDLGFYLSFSGILTFKNADPIREAAAYAPSDRILVETDSPYLAPVPFRGKRCEPAHVVYTARALAELRHVSLEQIARQTTENAERRLSVACG
jgi:TatD DNase family protein